MLRSFEVGNHKSFRGEQEFQLMPARDKDRAAVPVAAIYGANASGKSNLLDALGFMQRVVRDSFRLWEKESGIPRTPYALDIQGRLDPSSYVVQLFLDGVEHLYGFSLDDEKILEEWLYSYPLKKKRIIFERSGMEITLGSTLPEQASRTDLVKKLLRANALVLSAAAQVTAVPEAEPVRDWFRNRLRVAGDSLVAQGAPTTELVESALDLHPQFLELVRAADMGLTGIQVETTTEPMSRLDARLVAGFERRVRHAMSELPLAEAKAEVERLETRRRHLEVTRRRRVLVFLHGDESLPLSVKDQSAGTLSWLRLLPMTLDALAEGQVLIVDELDSSLHPRLIARLIELFQDKRTNANGAQLIFTTHDATLLGTSFGREILARDEIFFVEKDKSNQSKLVALTDFHPRKEDNRERRYLGGSYGGVPAVFSDTFVATMLEQRQETSNAEA
jgi:uncharacterized protein